MILAIIDGQGGGIGATIIKSIRELLGNDIEILALGTNATATSRMMKAGANRGATGENAIVRTAHRVDLIIGPIAILIANSMMGELTPYMASAIASSKARKIILPLTQENITLVGVSTEPLPHLVQQILHILKEVNNV